MSRAQSSLGKALQVHGDAVDEVEALYLEQSGECTEASTDAELARDMAAGVALEELARYRKWVTDQKCAIAAEYERLGWLAAQFEKRGEWADDRMAGLVRAHDPEAKERRAGLLTVKLRDTQRIVPQPDLDLGQLPPHWIREVAAVPAKTAVPALDKVAAKRDLKRGWRTGEPPGPGWYEARGELSSLFGPARIYLWKGLISGVWRCSSSLRRGRPVRPELFPMSTEWRHHAPGVELEHRVKVTID